MELNEIIDLNDDMDQDQDSPYEYTEGYDWSKHDFDNDPDWR